ncbi:14679_t:CDS:2 [Acaulospora colombiana]|uniref:14679_t:CDS:1 n=1 Tax=Acaulospora colombiana TaxID=27376 RepID=A0ACA9LAM0_9GLOM|nr:14679_t:CDS:2 [Acaulospora colombiana]
MYCLHRIALLQNSVFLMVLWGQEEKKDLGIGKERHLLSGVDLPLKSYYARRLV